MMFTTICRLTFDSRPAAGRSSGRKRWYPFRKVHNYGARRTGVRWYDGYNRPGQTDGLIGDLTIKTTGTCRSLSSFTWQCTYFIILFLSLLLALHVRVCWWIQPRLRHHWHHSPLFAIFTMVALHWLRNRAAQVNLARLSKTYVDNRSLTQRVLSISFVLYVLGTTYHGFSGGTGGRLRERRGKTSVQRKPGKESDRVAVCWHFIFYFVTNKVLR